ncbi:MAG: hypothetical protein KF855_03575 [Acidobacteria bacterium]|nr:hypothetical protein [Acidobacteriota bacterium]
MVESPPKPSNLSIIGASVGVVGLFVSIGWIVFGAGGQARVLDRHDDEIKTLQRHKENAATKEDIRRLESKIDQIIERELQRQR